MYGREINNIFILQTEKSQKWGINSKIPPENSSEWEKVFP
jgi:hypothetical protein